MTRILPSSPATLSVVTANAAPAPLSATTSTKYSATNSSSTSPIKSARSSSTSQRRIVGLRSACSVARTPPPNVTCTDWESLRGCGCTSVASTSPTISTAKAK